MKILTITSYVTNNSIPLLTKCKSGFGYMVYDIVSGVASKEDMDILLRNYRYDSFEIDKILFLENKVKNFFRNILGCSSIVIPIRLWWKYKMSLKEVAQLLYVWLCSGYYYNIIRTGSYDVVHLHGCGFYNDIYTNVCKRCNQKFIVTLHGLNSFSDSVNVEMAVKRYERDFLRRVVEGEFPITVISSGIKKIILAEYGLTECKNITVVCNSFSFCDKNEMLERNVDIKTIYNLPPNAKIILYVGNLCDRKNQKQIVDAFEFLPSEIKDECYVLFLGRDIEPEYQLESHIKKSQYNKHFIICGNIDKEMVPLYYMQGNAVVLLSKSEGFGLSLIEGMHFGLPCVTFEDLDAFEDIYDENAVVALSSRDDKVVAEGLQRLVTSEWDKEKIILHSRKFENEAMTVNYINQYKEIVYGR